MQEKLRGEAREKEHLLKQLDDAERRLQDAASSTKSKICAVQ